MQRATRKRRTKRSEIGNSLWDSVTDDWQCPACNRLKQEILRKIDGVWTDTDISGEDASVQAQANAKWTSAVKTAYQNMVDAA